MATEEIAMSKTTFAAAPGKPEIVMSRVFDAPRELVFAAYTDPKAIPQWWGPRRLTTVVERMDVSPGGAWRFVQHDADGNEFAFHGEFREVVPPERIVQTFEFEGMPGHIAVETAIFEDLGGQTRLTVTSVFASMEDRDGMLESGAEGGAVGSWERLGEYLAAKAQEGSAAPTA
jgi:uncharacterized protein YndB with AHSA1/START domain